MFVAELLEVDESDDLQPVFEAHNQDRDIADRGPGMIDSDDYIRVVPAISLHDA